MANESTNNEPGNEPGGNEPGKVFTQDQVNTLLADQKRKVQSSFSDYSDLKTKASQFDQLTASQQTELQKAEARAQTAEQTAQQNAADLARTRAALKYKLSEEDLDLLPTTGTAEEIDARAKRLSERLAPPPPNFDGGGRSTAQSGQNMNQLIRKAAGLG